MVRDFAFFVILGKPVVFYLGIITLSSFLFTASIAIMNKRGITIIPFKWHPRMAKTSLTLALIHGILALSAYLGF
ncbi:MAG: hypothetical protein Q7S70_02225 [bacterium]|nr:hypothetical protein [bacterium]